MISAPAVVSAKAMEPPALEYSAERPVRSWPLVRMVGLVTSAVALTALTVSLGMFKHVLPNVSLPGFGSIQKPLAWISIFLGIVGAIAAVPAWLMNRRGHVELVGLGLAPSYAALLTLVLIFFD